MQADVARTQDGSARRGAGGEVGATRITQRARTWGHPFARWLRPLAVGLTILFLICGAVLAVTIWNGASTRGWLWLDGQFYAGLGRRFLETGEMYFPLQFAGPYPAEGMVNLYPPIAMYLFVPAAILPLPLWWIVPLGIVAWHVWDCRPAWWTWPILALIAALVPTIVAVLWGNTVIWTAALVALACRWPAFGPLVAFKPTDLVAVVVFVRRRSFWAGAAVVIGASLLLLPYWPLWIEAMSNVAGSGFTRNVHNLPVALFPLVVWWGRTRRTSASIQRARTEPARSWAITGGWRTISPHAGSATRRQT